MLTSVFETVSDVTAIVFKLRNGKRRIWGLCFVVFFALLAPAAAQEPLKGVALVIGQADYEYLPKLANPGNDAKRVDEILTSLGFKTDMVDNRGGKRLKRDIEEFIEDADGADVALIYYSGHGIEAGGENYLVPVDAQAELEILDEGELIKTGPILEALRDKVRIAIVLLDACRTSPFAAGTVIRAGGDAQAQPIGSGGLTVGKGVMLIADGAASESLGEVIGFAAAPGAVALDGEPGSNSPYAAALAKHLSAGNRDFGQVMTLVAEEVYLATKGRQRPWTNANLRRLLYFGKNPEDAESDEALIRGERRQLLLTIAATPLDLRRTVETIASVDNVPLGGLYAMLRTLGVEAQRDPEKLGEQLKAGAEKLKSILAEREALKSTDVEIVRLSDLANRAVGEGAIDAANAFHGKAKARVAALEGNVEAAEADIAARRLEFADVYARSARTLELGFNYLAAAEDWAKAYRNAERWDSQKAFAFRIAEADALRNHGNLKGSVKALADSIELYGLLLKSVDPQKRADDWATIQKNLGTSLRMFGEVGFGTDSLEQAVAAHDAALHVWTRERAPRSWARTQVELGKAYWRLGQRETGTDKLKDSVEAYRAALEVLTREEAPLDWAMAQNYLAGSLRLLGERTRSRATFEEAVAAYRAALLEWTRERAPFDWARLQNNLGLVFNEIGARDNDMAKHLEAIAAFRAALQEWTRERAPMYWATVQSNMGLALADLGKQGDTARLEEAIAAYRAALEEWTREKVPFDWAAAQGNLASALRELGDRQDNGKILDEAVAAYRAVLLERTRDRAPLDWAKTQNGLGLALNSIGRINGDMARVAEAIAAHRAALQVVSRDESPDLWADIHYNLGWAFFALGDRDTGVARLEEAVVAFRAALRGWSREAYPVDWANTQYGLGQALMTIDDRAPRTARLEEAVVAFRAALAQWSPAASTGSHQSYAQYNLGRALLSLHERQSGDTAELEQAVVAFRAAVAGWTRDLNPLDWADAQYLLGVALAALGRRESGTARLEEAVDAYRAALQELSPAYSRTRWARTQVGLGVALAAIGERQTGTARFEEAVGAFRAALQELSPEWAPLDWANAQYELGMALGWIGRRESGTARLEEAVAALRASAEAVTRAEAPDDWVKFQDGLGSALRTLGERERETAR